MHPPTPVPAEQLALYDGHTGVSVSAAEGQEVASAPAPRKALILRNHGLLTVGDTVDAATWWFLSLERSCQIQLAAQAAGRPVPIAHEQAVDTRDRLGSDLAAWINYQPLWTDITRSEPDLLTG